MRRWHQATANVYDFACWFDTDAGSSVTDHANPLAFRLRMAAQRLAFLRLLTECQRPENLRVEVRDRYLA